MAKRKGLSKKIRFEVFKRDSFTCQYCGNQAPDFVLCVDHIVPVASGGQNDSLNLITACFDCNAGKSDRSLKDDAVVKKQFNQIKELSERRIQIEMIAKWRSGLASMEDLKLLAVRDAIDVHLNPADKTVSDNYLRTELKSALKTYGFEEVLESIEKSANQYLKDPRSESDRDKFLTMIPRICYWSKYEKANPEIAKIRKIAYSARKRWSTCNSHTLTARLLQLHQRNKIPVDDLYVGIMGASGIMKFEDWVGEYLESGDFNG